MPVNAFADFQLENLDDFNAAGREEEALFARDENDQLVRREKETRKRFLETVSIQIDGYTVTVPRATPMTDAMGNLRRDTDGQLIPRTTTIYDAAIQLVRDGIWNDEDLKTRIPVLCHAQHLDPVAVCRMCSVHISSIKKGRLTPGRKLVPACQHRVEKDMIVTTRCGSDRHREGPGSQAANEVAKYAENVNRCVSLLSEFLIADHRHPDLSVEPRFDNELEHVAEALKVAEPRESLKRRANEPSRNQPTEANPRARRFELPIVATTIQNEELAENRREANAAWVQWNELIDEKYPYSSPTVIVDHDRCILCDRCARSCSDVRPFKIIGHTGKGYQARISFDLDRLMSDSNCVQCGECMTSCPTGALSLRRRVQPRAWDDSPKQIPQNPNLAFPSDSSFLTAKEIREIEIEYRSPKFGLQTLRPFNSVPYAYLKWNEGAVRRRVIKRGTSETLCNEGDYGSTAFLLSGRGKFDIYLRGKETASPAKSFLGKLLGREAKKDRGERLATVPGDQLILGEMACMTHRARSTTVVAVADGDADVVVYEITRNMLDMLQRSPAARDAIKDIYLRRALQTGLNKLFKDLDPSLRARVTDFLIQQSLVQSEPMSMSSNASMSSLSMIEMDAPFLVDYRFVNPNESVVEQGDAAGAFYVVYLGFLRVEEDSGPRQIVINYRKPGDYFGELALLASDPELQAKLPPGVDLTRRSATVAAIDRSELIRLSPAVFREMCARFPEVKKIFLDRALQIFGPRSPLKVEENRQLPEFVSQGLYQAQKMLVLDLTRCTRCDECTRACADHHTQDHQPRMLREGLRFGDFLVATSCRSCHTPYCMDYCPVDAIHRKENRLEVLIEDHCIGCSLCERNCPYGSIHMAAKGSTKPGEVAKAGFRKATNCDLCEDQNYQYCVASCPHEAAFRVNGEDLLARVASRTITGQLTVF